jgi:hypothetical protein
VLHLKNQPFRAWQYIYMGVFSHTNTDNPTDIIGPSLPIHWLGE